MNTQTIVNGKELKHYDKFLMCLKNLERGFINQKDYKGYPTLPENYLDAIDIYLNADTDERIKDIGSIKEYLIFKTNSFITMLNKIKT